MNLILHLFKKNESVKEETIEQEVIEIKKDIIIPKEESKYQRLYLRKGCIFESFHVVMAP